MYDHKPYKQVPVGVIPSLQLYGTRLNVLTGRDRVAYSKPLMNIGEGIITAGVAGLTH